MVLVSTWEMYRQTVLGVLSHLLPTIKMVFDKKEWKRIDKIHHPDKYKKQSKKYRDNNKDKIKDYGKEYFQKKKKEDPEKIKELNRIYRAKKYCYIDGFTSSEWRHKLYRTHGVCPKCKVYVSIPKLQLDHISPVSRALDYYKLTGVKVLYKIYDVQPLCKSCNVKKKDDFYES